MVIIYLQAGESVVAADLSSLPRKAGMKTPPTRVSFSMLNGRNVEIAVGNFI